MIHRFHHLLDARSSDNFSVYITVNSIDRNMLRFDSNDIYVYQRVKYRKKHKMESNKL